MRETGGFLVHAVDSVLHWLNSGRGERRSIPQLVGVQRGGLACRSYFHLSLCYCISSSCCWTLTQAYPTQAYFTMTEVTSTSSTDYAHQEHTLRPEASMGNDITFHSDDSREETLRKIRIADSIAIPRDVFEKLYPSPPTADSRTSP